MKTSEKAISIIFAIALSVAAARKPIGQGHAGIAGSQS